MSKAVSLSAKIDSNLKELAETILDQIGLTPSQAITLFYKQVALRRGLPFKLEIPPATVSDDEAVDWASFALKNLENAYGDSEPEYSLHLIRENNPEYKA